MADNNIMSCLQDIEEKAKETMPKPIFENYSSGANQMTTLNDNRKAFSKYKLKPRMLIDVSTRNTKTSILGTVKLRAVYYSILELFGQRSQYISIKFKILGRAIERDSLLLATLQ